MKGSFSLSTFKLLGTFRLRGRLGSERSKDLETIGRFSQNSLKCLSQRMEVSVFSVKSATS